VDKSSKIYIAGHFGLVGSAIHRKLSEEGYENLVVRSPAELDLVDQAAVNSFFAQEKPEYVFLAAAKVGGIQANRCYPAEFIYQNLMIQSNVIHAAWLHSVQKLLFLGSSCVYPKHAAQPIREKYLLTGPLEPANEAYAIAKIAGIKMAQAYHRQYGLSAICLMPTNLYGPGDNFDLNTSHVLPALIRKFHAAKQSGMEEVIVWGTGAPRREFLHVDDLADAALFLMLHYDSEEIINVGTGKDIAISKLCEMIREITGYQGRIIFDASMPDGTPRKVLDISRIAALGWSPQRDPQDGIRQTYVWFAKAVSSS
jgi:GDP-L-fucose synthase